NEASRGLNQVVTGLLFLRERLRIKDPGVIGRVQHPPANLPSVSRVVPRQWNERDRVIERVHRKRKASPIGGASIQAVHFVAAPLSIDHSPSPPRGTVR